MNKLQLEIMRLLKSGVEVNRYNQTLLDAGHRGFEIDDMCGNIVGRDFAQGIQSSNYDEQSWVIGNLTERGEAALSDAESKL